jgi:uncharacterized protein YciI
MDSVPHARIQHIVGNRPERGVRLDDARCGRAGEHDHHAGMLILSEVAMFVIELIYKVDLAEIDAHMAAHVTFLKKYYTAGNFLISGRKIPRDGGIILAVGKSRRQIEAIVEEDPFYEHDLADFRIIEFRASQRANDIQKRIERN